MNARNVEFAIQRLSHNDEDIVIREKIEITKYT